VPLATLNVPGNPKAYSAVPSFLLSFFISLERVAGFGRSCVVGSAWFHWSCPTLPPRTFCSPYPSLLTTTQGFCGDPPPQQTPKPLLSVVFFSPLLVVPFLPFPLWSRQKYSALNPPSSFVLVSLEILPLHFVSFFAHFPLCPFTFLYGTTGISIVFFLLTIQISFLSMPPLGTTLPLPPYCRKSRAPVCPFAI